MLLWQVFERIAVAMSAFFAMLLSLGGDGNNSGQYYDSSEKAASDLLLSLNSSVEPCDDFYEHACGGWIAKNPIPEGPHNKISRFADIDLKIHHEIKESLEAVNANDVEALQKAKKYYDACINWDAIERRGLSPLEEILTENGEWPLIVPSDKWNPQGLTWQQIHENLAKRVGVSSLFQIKVVIDRNDSNAYMIQFNVPQVPSKKGQYGFRTNPKVYEKYLRNVTEAFKNSSGLSVDETDFQDDIKKMFEFEDTFFNLSEYLADDDVVDERFDRTVTIEELQAEWDSATSMNSLYAVDWLKLISDRFDGTGIVINKLENVSLFPRTIIKKLARALVDTPVRTIVNYMHWRMIDKRLPLTNSKIRNPASISLDGIKLSTICIVDHTMTNAVSYLYVTKHSSKAAKLAARKIAGYVRDAMTREIDGCTWLDDASKTMARGKIDAMTNYIGYPDWFDEPGKIDEYYRELAIGSDHFENMIASKKFDSKIELSRLRATVSNRGTGWPLAPHTANGEYDPRTNSLYFSAALLQSPFFVDGRPSALNYGGFAATIGHEISHSFDYAGQLWLEYGGKKEWWPKSAIKTWQNKSQCFDKQYSEYVLYNDSANNEIGYVDSWRTLQENIADTTGFKIGFRALQIAENAVDFDSSKSHSLANITDEQLYFYQVAQTHCETVSLKELKAYSWDTHSPSRLRIIGAFSNLKEFADAFNCPAGSPMNPAKKCLIWD